MAEIFCLLLGTIAAFCIYGCYNLIKTLFNIKNRLMEVLVQVQAFEEMVNRLNSTETYYGDATIQAFVDAAKDLRTALMDIAEITEEIEGDYDQD